jgi:hypothetical protein
LPASQLIFGACGGCSRLARISLHRSLFLVLAAAFRDLARISLHRSLFLVLAAAFRDLARISLHRSVYCVPLFEQRFFGALGRVSPSSF